MSKKDEPKKAAAKADEAKDQAKTPEEVKAPAGIKGHTVLVLGENGKPVRAPLTKEHILATSRDGRTIVTVDGRKLEVATHES